LRRITRRSGVRQVLGRLGRDGRARVCRQPSSRRRCGRSRQGVRRRRRSQSLVRPAQRTE
jgi:hypothetical protein